MNDRYIKEMKEAHKKIDKIKKEKDVCRIARSINFGVTVSLSLCTLYYWHIHDIADFAAYLLSFILFFALFIFLLKIEKKMKLKLGFANAKTWDIYAAEKYGYETTEDYIKARYDNFHLSYNVL